MAKKLTVNQILLGQDLGELIDQLPQVEKLIIVGITEDGSIRVVTNANLPAALGALMIATNQLQEGG